jgi:hypothetical protein
MAYPVQALLASRERIGDSGFADSTNGGPSMIGQEYEILVDLDDTWNAITTTKVGSKTKVICRNVGVAVFSQWV